MFEIPNISKYYRKVNVFEDDTSDSADTEFEPPSKRPKRNRKSIIQNDVLTDQNPEPGTSAQASRSKNKMTVECYMNEANRNMWEEFQKPYGNQSTFMRHLILLEKYFRSGDISVTPNANQDAIAYVEKVRNRFEAYDNVPPQSKST